MKKRDVMDNDQQTTIYFPNGKPVPEVLTEQETITFLRLDDGPKHPEMTLQYYRTEGLLKGIRIGRKMRYTKTELLRFLDRLYQAKENKS
jgi:hypothetical protein